MPQEASLCGIFRYVPHHSLLAYLSHGWRFVADLGETHGQWSSLLWWCSGTCRDGEAPC